MVIRCKIGNEKMRNSHNPLKTCGQVMKSALMHSKWSVVQRCIEKWA